MKKIIYALICSMLFCCACSDTIVISDSQPQVQQHVFISFECGDMISTRSTTFETRIDDINLYLFPQNGNPALHLFLSREQSVVVELPYGDYMLYAVANFGHDTGDRTQDSVRALRVVQTSSASADALIPMSAEQSVSVQGDMQISVSLIRVVAKVNFSYTIATDFAKTFCVKTVQLRCVPQVAAPFCTNRADSEETVADLSPVETTATAYTTTYYLLENKQGRVAGIGSQQQKDRTHAPKYATYIAIIGDKQGVNVEYRIYLGENNTTDFNVERNRIYNIDAHIVGMNTVDWRVSTTELFVEPFDKSYVPQKPATTQLKIVSINAPENLFYLSYRIDKGTGTVTIDGRETNPASLYPLNSDKEIATAEIAYTQAGPGEVSLHLTVTDKFGYSMEFELSTVYIEPEMTVTFTQKGREVSILERAFIDYTISQPGYTGTYAVTIEGIPTVFRGSEGSEVPQTTFTENGNGTYSLRVKPERLGDNPMKVTVADMNGNSADFTTSVVGIPAKAFLKPRFSISETFLKVEIESTLPVLEDLWVTLTIKGERVTIGGSATPVDYKALVVLQQGQTTCYAAVPLDIWVSNNYFNLISYTGNYNRFSANQLVEYILL